MNFLDIKTSVYENFSDFHLSKGFTLAESEFYDTFSKSFDEYSKDDLDVNLRESYNDDIAHDPSQNNGQYFPLKIT
ncbi:hypothetical protein LVY74_17130 [Acinetobacter sp. ME22]|uniref:hypothetical protein n=1 Tax=Acinetobacter sp. ME22 TaxID=2904802 RepID=UPI001EDBD327|nr:hypothetical protein [Acinetobacter sp. ME22]MCG2575260.1 hypothetical protein [Acinetobacter sp. ME22]